MLQKDAICNLGIYYITCKNQILTRTIERTNPEKGAITQEAINARKPSILIIRIFSPKAEPSMADVIVCVLDIGNPRKVDISTATDDVSSVIKPTEYFVRYRPDEILLSSPPLNNNGPNMRAIPIIIFEVMLLPLTAAMRPTVFAPNAYAKKKVRINMVIL